jgi:hypothetical protein
VKVTLDDYEGSDGSDDGFIECRGIRATEVPLDHAYLARKSSRIRDSKSVVGVSCETRDQDYTRRYVSNFGGRTSPTQSSNTGFRNSVMLTNNTAMTASRMPAVRKDPNEEFFKMSLLAYKLNNA